MRQGSYTTADVSLALYPLEEEVRLEEGFALVTQTCDVVRADVLQVCPLVRRPDRDQAVVRPGSSPRYMPIAGSLCADLGVIHSVPRAALESVDGSLVELDLDNEKAFRQAVGRRFGRLALPTHVADSFSRLRDYLVRKSKKPDSQGGKMVRRIEEIRVAISPNWSEGDDKESLVVTLLLKANDLADPLDSPSATEDLKGTLSALGDKDPGPALEALCALMAQNEPAGSNDYAIWRAICNQFSRMISNGLAALPPGTPAVEVVTVGVTTKGWMTVAEYEDTEALDLTHLSGVDEASSGGPGA